MTNTLAVSYILDQTDNNLILAMMEYDDIEEAYKEIDAELQPTLDKITQLTYILTDDSHYNKIDNFLFIKYGVFK